MMLALLPLFLLSAAAVGVEIALTRFFAVASFSEYGYWVISIAMTGFAVSGVVMVLGREAFLRRTAILLPALPLAMLVAGAAGWIEACANPFNPLELQNPATAWPQLENILGYYAALFPFFFLAGLAVSLNFVARPARIGLVYGYDLLGAGAGAVAALLLMLVLHPFLLVPALLPLLALATALAGGLRWRVAALVVLAAAEAAVLAFAAPAVSPYKPVYAPLNVQGGQVLGTWTSPRGFYQLLDNFTERLDTDVTNNAGSMGLPAPPRAYGLYRDGSRIAALPMRVPPETGHAPGALDAAPYALLAAPRVLLLGAAGGFRPAEALALGAAHVTVIEPEPLLRDALRHGLGPAPPMAADARVTLSAAHSLRAEGRFDLVDVSGDFLGADDQNRHAYTREAMAARIAQLEPGGLLSIPVSIRELPAYAVRVIATARDSLLLAGIADPAAHLAVIRSAWNLRVLVAREAFDAERVATLVAFAEARSFDLSWAPGLPPGREVWNEVSAVSLDSGGVDSRTQDAVAEEAAALLAGTPRRDAFDRSPLTADRPWLSPLVRLPAVGSAIERMEVLPQPEIGLLVNVGVLAQAVLLALVVAGLPLLAPRLRGGALRVRPAVMARALVFFPALGLGFLMVEIALIEQAALLLGDRVAGFALVLTAMLVFSGAGAMLAGGVAHPGRALRWAALAALGLGAAAAVALPVILAAALDWPFALRAGLLVALLAPLSLAMGMPFPLGLDRFRQEGAALLPWAWALNGAFSVVATPLANLVAHGIGIAPLLLAGAACYAAVALAWPRSAAA
jgi:hypothetical protein